MLALFIDIDNCPDYLQVFRAVQRHTLELYVVTRDYLHVDMDVHLILAQEGDAGARDWIAANISSGDICVTNDSVLASSCRLRGATALEPAVDPRIFAQRLEAAIATARSVNRRSALGTDSFSGSGLGTARLRVQQTRGIAD
jgi:uncharacterized protein YaiI (UPF0178 family)